ncbi:hypothetical protein WMY93_005657 [Mugilogobius chulae]|uniref:Uncharacterized protein n=1 Tax=Mugilogobius chulae TaxID=88201 RepID=A0AAW0PKD8_9GOBI
MQKLGQTVLPDCAEHLRYISKAFSEARPQGLRVLLGSDFTATCSIDAQHEGGVFQLLTPIGNYTQSAVNHSARFLFSDAGPAHIGYYICVHHPNVFLHNFSTMSQPLYVSLGAFNRDLIIRALVFVLLQLTYSLLLHFCCCKNPRRGLAGVKPVPS